MVSAALLGLLFFAASAPAQVPRLPGDDDLLRWMGYQPGDVLAFEVGGERICSRVGDPLTIDETRYVPIEGLLWPGLTRVLVPLDGSVSLSALPPFDSLPIAVEGWTPPSELTWVGSLATALRPPALHDGWFAVGEADSSPRYLIYRWCAACMDTGSTVVLGRGTGILWVEWTTFTGSEKMFSAEREICTEPEEAYRRRAAMARGRTLTRIGDAHRLAGRADSALVYYERALSELERTGGRRDLVFNRIMSLEPPAGSEARLRIHHKKLEIYRRFEYRAAEGVALMNLASVHEALGRPDSALTYYASALTIAREGEDHSDERVVLESMGDVHLEAGRPDSALSYYEQVLTSYRAHHQHAPGRRGEVGILIRIGDVYCDLGRSELADARYQEAIAIREQDVAWRGGPTGREDGCTKAGRAWPGTER